MFNKVKKTMNQLSQKGKEMIVKTKNFALPAALVAIMMPCATFATTANLVGAVLGVLCAVLKYVGIVIIAIGFILFLFNMHDDNPDKKQKIIITMVIGAAMFGGQMILQAICDAANLGVTVNGNIQI